ncbi:MAG: hypothetical protein WCS15_06335 [Prevotella sp.]
MSDYLFDDKDLIREGEKTAVFEMRILSKKASGRTILFMSSIDGDHRSAIYMDAEKAKILINALKNEFELE